MGLRDIEVDTDELKSKFSHSWKKYAGVAALLVTGWESFYVNNPTEMANATFLGHVEHKTPQGPGPHLVIPFSSVDKIQVSQRHLEVPEFDVKTVDNQNIKLKLNFSYTVPQNEVNHLLYQVGGTGNKDLENMIIPVVQDRASRVYNTQNTTTLSANRAQIQKELEESIYTALEKQFGIQPVSLQIAHVGYSEAFDRSNDFAVTAKNDAIAEQNKVNIEVARANQRVASAKGLADSQVEAARGQADSTIKIAEGEKQKAILEGEGESSKLKAEIGAFGSPAAYNDFLRATAANKWNGQMPQIQSGAAGGSPTVVVPFNPK